MIFYNEPFTYIHFLFLHHTVCLKNFLFLKGQSGDSKLKIVSPVKFPKLQIRQSAKRRQNGWGHRETSVFTRPRQCLLLGVQKPLKPIHFGKAGEKLYRIGGSPNHNYHLVEGGRRKCAENVPFFASTQYLPRYSNKVCTHQWACYNLYWDFIDHQQRPWVLKIAIKSVPYLIQRNTIYTRLMPNFGI